jgi:negative regulator of sigma E activity
MLGHRFEGAGFTYSDPANPDGNPSSQEVHRMRVSTAHPRSGAWSQRVAWFFAASALTLTLALGGCRTGANNNSSNSGNQTPSQTQQSSSATSGVSSGGSSTGSTTGSNNSSSLQQLENIDSQDQNDSQQLNSAQNDAGVNYSSQENNTLP